jgi:DNA-binding CsgD family transcriptional regulator
MTDSSKLGPMPPLTPREYEACRLVADGLTNKEIAVRMTISVSTVQAQLGNATRKLQARNRVDLARWIWRGRIQTMMP